MKKFIKKRMVLQVLISVFAAAIATVGIVSAATTIGANINTTGTTTLGDTATDSITANGYFTQARIGTGAEFGHIGTVGADELGVEGAMEVDGIAWFDGSLRASSTLMVTGTSTINNTLDMRGGNKAIVLGGASSATGIPTLAGSIYYDSTNAVIKLNDGTSWYTVGTSTGGMTLETNKIRLSNISHNITLGTTTAQGLSQMTLEATSTVAIPLSIVADTSQSANLLQIMNDAATNLLVVNSSGYLGVGSTSPTTHLSIDTDAGVSSLMIGSTTATYLEVDENGDLIVDTDSLFVDASASRVGIGTATPAYLLDVDGDLRVGEATKDSTFFVDTSEQEVGLGTTTAFAMLSIDTNGGKSSFIIGSTTATYLHVDNDGDLIVDTDSLFVDASASRVGIGTATPAYLLDVDGDVRVGEATKDSTFFVDTSEQEVGLGTTTPFAMLSIDTNGGKSSFIIGSTTATYLELDENGDLIVDTDTLFVDNSTNRVGISSSTPTADLSIGTLSATSTIAAGRLCFLAEDSLGNLMYVSLCAITQTCVGDNVWATSTDPCN